ncbi:neuropeptide FF receptor 1 like 2 [Synchiropus splendidus]|uniref:neuropeptide FF receptor 1 like 2 n=1 Tax=Synchiropus splendidus TaxID=270530 RepID=UPI00237E11C9|nr:neuropeptide FF receptor 1 like 2 [Synchiropus splendidus]
MEFVDPLKLEETSLEGSTPMGFLINSSYEGEANITNMTFSPYYQHTAFVAAGYILAYTFIFLLCMVGNMLVCLIMLENRRMRTVTNLFILNLAVSDLLVGIFCIPTTLVDGLITGWPFSSMVCKMSGFIQGVSVSASVFTLVAIAVERFRCIVFPLKPKPSISVAKASILLIWILAIVIMCPAASALTVEEVPFHRLLLKDRNQTFPLYTCYEDFSKPAMRRVYTAVLFANIYMVPLTLITVMYGSIGVKLYTSVVGNRVRQLPDNRDQARVRQGGQPLIPQRKIRVIKMLILVTLLFMISWLPLWTLMMMTDYAGLDREQVDLLITYFFPFAHWLAFSNSSVNPIIYGYFNENFKRGFQVAFKARNLDCVTCCNLWQRIRRLGRKGRTIQVQQDDTNARGPSNHRDILLLGMQRQGNDETAEPQTPNLNLGARLGHAAIQPCPHDAPGQGVKTVMLSQKTSSGEESGRVSPRFHAWNN